MTINLCFHGIGEPERELELDEDQCWVSVERFDELLDAAEGLPSLQITFDDGNASDAAIALPTLVARGLTAAFFVIAGRIDRPGSVSAQDVRALADAGMTIGSHGMHHVPWRFLDETGLRRELDEAVPLIAEAAGRSVAEASCPFGAYDRRVLRALRERGFSRVYTVDPRPAAPNAWLQGRYAIRHTDTADSVRSFGRDAFPRKAVLAVKSAAKRWR